MIDCHVIAWLLAIVGFTSPWKSVSVHTKFSTLRSDRILAGKVYCHHIFIVWSVFSAIHYSGFCGGLSGQHGCVRCLLALRC